MYSLASELGREDNDLLWQAIVGVSSLELSGRTSQGVGLVPVNTSGTTSSWTRDRGERIRSILRDEVRRLNPTDLKDIARIESMGDANGIIQTHARSPNDNSIRLSPEPRFLLVRHWSLYDSMRHSPFLGAKLHIWSEPGRKRLNKFLAKMGISLAQSKQNYTHMDMQLKRDLRERLLKYAPVYGLDGLVPPQVNRGVGGKEGWGFVRCWGWKACLSALDAGVVLGAILEVGDMDETLKAALDIPPPLARSGRDTPRTQEEPSPQTDLQASEAAREEALTKRFWAAYDALSNVSLLTQHIATAQHLYRAILRTGASLLEKKQIRHLRAFRMAVVKDGPDVQLFTHPGALTKLALWVSEAVAEVEGSKGRKGGELVMASLDEERGVYTVVGLGGGSGVVKQREAAARKAEKRTARELKRAERAAARSKRKQLRRERIEANGEEWDSELESEDETESESSGSEFDSEDEDEESGKGERGRGLNRFGLAFAEAVEQTGARVRQDSFEHSVVELKKEDLGGFLEALSLKVVVG
jgi:cell division control protein 45